MREIESVTYNQMIHAWLKSESFRLIEHRIPYDKKLIDTPDFNSIEENTQRRQLMFCRNPILNGIPSDTECAMFEVGKKDIKNIYIIPCRNWFLDTGKTFELQTAFEDILHNRGYQDGNGNNQVFDNLNKVNQIIQYWKINLDVEKDEKLIIVGNTEEGPFTIIDGTHRAIAFEKTINSYPWHAFVGISKGMINYEWHIESHYARARINQFHKDHSLGLLW